MAQEAHPTENVGIAAQIGERLDTGELDSEIAQEVVGRIAVGSDSIGSEGSGEAVELVAKDLF